jgi:cytochrome c peroxidase
MKLLIFGLLLCMFCACGSDSELMDQPILVRVPARFPAAQYPKDNEPSMLRVLLGRKLFYDNRLSSENNLNCGSCHVLSAAFTDGRATSVGMHGTFGRRNAPTLVNLAWSPRLMMEGGVPSLETQALAPLHDSLEMGTNMMVAVDKLNQDRALRSLAKAAYNRDSIDPYVITRALAAFQRTFISGDSRFDRYQQGIKNELNDNEIRGMELFFSEKTSCGSCHPDVLMTDHGYYNIGLYEVYSDHGKERATGKPQDIGKFKTPTLRNIALTSPYMHDGSIWSLPEVVAFFNEGGKSHANKDDRMRPLNLSTQEQNDLVAFLQSLTDWNFVQNQQLLPLVK